MMLSKLGPHFVKFYAESVPVYGTIQLLINTTACHQGEMCILVALVFREC